MQHHQIKTIKGCLKAQKITASLKNDGAQIEEVSSPLTNKASIHSSQ